MKTFITFILSVACLAGFAQQKDNRITIGTVDTVYSNILKEKRAIYVHVPQGGDKNARYPVLYILDADQHFESAVAMDEQFRPGLLPDMIVIGITNTNRERDLTPTHVQPYALLNAGESKQSGGGENFMAFMERELIPYVDTHYPTTTYRVFSGHSLGGLAVINAFFNHTSLFNAFIAIDPSVWWDHEQWIKKQEAELPQRDFSNKALFVAMANNIPPGMDTISIFKDTTVIAPVTHAVLPFVRYLRGANPKGLMWDSKFYPNEWHGVVEFNAEYDALRYLFKFYRFDLDILRQNPNLNADSLLTEHYKAVSKVLGYTVLPTEENMNNLGYFYMGINRMDRARDILKLNTVNYPQSANAWDSLGECYAAMGNKQKAIEAYQKSLSLQETVDTRKKLEDLTKK
jgi:predicted alpha/beta superfamily hydrolase